MSVESSVLLRAGIALPDEQTTVRTGVLASLELIHAGSSTRRAVKRGRGNEILTHSDLKFGGMVLRAYVHDEDRKEITYKNI